MNLLEETIGTLKQNNLTEKDVKWVGSNKVYTDWENFALIADVDYDDGYGGQEVSTDIIIVGEDWWLERHEYDGSEWWEFKRTPQKPNKKVKLTNIICDSWSTLKQNNAY